MEQTSKQVIVVRKDLGMEIGKGIAQGIHAGQAFLLEHIFNGTKFTPEQHAWAHDGKQTVIVKYVNSEAELIKVFSKAREANIPAHLVTDLGLTVFNNEPTNTCISIGPHFEDVLKPVVKRLQNL